MKVSDIHKSQAIYNALVKLDSEIIAIEKKAIALANNQAIVKFTLEIPKIILGHRENMVNTEGDILKKDIEGYSYISPFYFVRERYLDHKKENAKETESIEHELDETEALIMLQVLVDIKKSKRLKLINQLRALGFK